MKTFEAVAAVRSFNRFYTNIIGLVDRFILDSNYSLTEVRILWEIAHNSELNARKIMQSLQIDEGYLSRTIKKLTAANLIGKKKSRSDSRVYSLYLTEEGARTFNELNEKSSVEIGELIRDLTEREISDLISCMRRITAILRREENIDEDRHRRNRDQE